MKPIDSGSAAPTNNVVGSWSPFVAAILGAWLVVSSFLWPHTPVQRLNTVMCGVLAMIVATATLRSPRARYLNIVVGIWLFFSTYLLKVSALRTEWNELFVGIALVGISVLPNRLLTWRGVHRRTSARAG